MTVPRPLYCLYPIHCGAFDIGSQTLLTLLVLLLLLAPTGVHTIILRAHGVTFAIAGLPYYRLEFGTNQVF
ncbi:hypothetical protein F4824DRAFT_166243 [Ustulina deusta]|nr:hypothetical protein F4824DRAFT_166243 [Ustulina deusta]